MQTVLRYFSALLVIVGVALAPTSGSESAQQEMQRGVETRETVVRANVATPADPAPDHEAFTRSEKVDEEKALDAE